MIRIDKESYLKLGAAELNSSVIKSWELSEFTSEESVSPEELKSFLQEHLGADHSAVTAAAASDEEHPLSAEACEALLRAFDPRAAVEEEIARAAARAAAKKPPEPEPEPEPGPEPEPELEPMSEEEAENLAEEIMREAEEQAEEMLSSVQSEAQETLSSARKQAEEMLGEARSALTAVRQQAEETANAARSEAAALVACAQREAENLVACAQREAENLLIAAHREAEGIVGEAESKRQAVYGAATEKGYSEGITASRNAILKVREDYESRLRDLFEQVQSYNDMRNAELEQNVLALSLDVAESILGITLDRDFEPFFDLVKSAVTQLNAKTRFVMRLNKREYDRFMEKDEVTRAVLSEVPFSVICDGSLEPGALLLQADEGTVDAGVKTQLSRVKRVFGMANEDT